MTNGLFVPHETIKYILSFSNEYIFLANQIINITKLIKKNLPKKSFYKSKLVLVINREKQYILVRYFTCNYKTGYLSLGGKGYTITLKILTVPPMFFNLSRKDCLK